MIQALLISLLLAGQLSVSKQDSATASPDSVIVVADSVTGIVALPGFKAVLVYAGYDSLVVKNADGSITTFRGLKGSTYKRGDYRIEKVKLPKNELPDSLGKRGYNIYQKADSLEKL